MKPQYAVICILQFVTFLVSAQEYPTQNVTGLPSCAVPCVLAAIQAFPCDATNITCLCHDQTIVSNFSSCSASTCKPRELLQTAKTYSEICGNQPRDASKELALIQPWAALAITSAVVLARLLARVFPEGPRLSLARLGWEDLFIVLTFIAAAAQFVSLAVTIELGFGRDLWTLTPDQITQLGKIFTILQPIFFLEGALLKASFVAFYMRIFTGKGAGEGSGTGAGSLCGLDFGRVLAATMAVNAASGAIFVALSLGECVPLSYAWTRWDGEHQGHCGVSVNSLGWANAMVGIALDLWLLYLPLSQIPRLNLTAWRKIGVGLMFCGGFLYTTVTILRVRSFVTFASSVNSTYDNFPGFMLGLIDMVVGIVFACMPTLGILLVRTLPRALRGLSRRRCACAAGGVRGRAESGSGSGCGAGPSRRYSHVSSTRSGSTATVTAAATAMATRGYCESRQKGDEEQDIEGRLEMSVVSFPPVDTAATLATTTTKGPPLGILVARPASEGEEDEVEEKEEDGNEPDVPQSEVASMTELRPPPPTPPTPASRLSAAEHAQTRRITPEYFPPGLPAPPECQTRRMALRRLDSGVWKTENAV